MTCPQSHRKWQAWVLSVGPPLPKPSFHGAQLPPWSHQPFPALSFRCVFGKSRKIAQVLASCLNEKGGDSSEFTCPQAPPSTCYLHESVSLCSTLGKRARGRVGNRQDKQTAGDLAGWLRGRRSVNPGTPEPVTFLRPKPPLGLALLLGMTQEFRDGRKISPTVTRGKDLCR